MTTPVAIVGMSVLMPGAPDLDTYWRNITTGVDAITDVPAERWDADYYEPDLERRADRVYCRRGGFVDPLAEVDVMSFGIMPNSVAGTEPDQLIALHVAAAAIADAGGDTWLPPDRERVGVILGRGGYLTPALARLDQRVRTARQLVRTLGQLMPELGDEKLEQVRQAFSDQLGPDSPESAIGLVPNLAASRVANRLDLRGPAYTVDAACASSLVAVDHAVRELADRRCDVMLAGGVHHCHDITLWSVFTQLGALSPSQRIRPFHRGADGVLIGEGTGVVVLKRLADAERDGDRVYAVITGTGVASDGRTASLVNPDTGGQVRAIRQAWLAAGTDPALPGSIGLLEAHGTATPAGDTAELATLAEVFGPASATDRPVIGSVKSMIGHTMPAAGVAALVKAALAVHHGILPPTLHCDDPNPALAATRFEPIAEVRPWIGEVRRAGVNAFGFGGINAHVVLEQAPTSRPGPASVREPERVLRLSASSPGHLAAMLDTDDATVLATGLDEREAATGPTRLGIVDPTPKRLALARKAVAKGAGWRGRNDVWFAPKPLLGNGGGKLAFIFPGLEAEFAPSVDALARRFGLDWRSDAPVGDVGRHGKGVFQLGRLLDAVLRRLGVRPDAVAGHSVGEWTAMAAGGIHAGHQVDAFLDRFDPDALRVPGLAFAVLGAPADRVRAALANQSEVVLSHDNAPSQSMICGPSDAVGALVLRFRADGVISQVLPFQSGFHTPMLKPYLAPIQRAAETYDINPARVPVWSATTAAEFPTAPDDVRDLFVRHLLEPVRFRPMIEAMHAAGFRAFVQLGVGQVGSLVADTLQGKDNLVVSTHSPHRDGLDQVRRVVTALWADGAEPDVSALLPTTPRRRTPVRLDLGGALISLDSRTRLRMPGQASALDGLVDGSPLAAELSSLLRDTADVAAELLTARRPAPAPTRLDSVLRVSVDTMPYLLDHCFFQQRPGWPDHVDSWPVVPATTVIGHLMAFAEQAAPGRRAVAVHDVRLSQWITAIPSVDVPVSVVPAGDDRVLASFDGYSRAVVELAAEFPAGAPSPWKFTDERTPDLTARELYDERWMFHGPRFQGVEELTAIGAEHVRAELVTPAAPGALLDNVGQVLGYWIMASLPDRTTVFPVAIGRIRFHGEHPAAGERLECLVRITSVTDTALTADMQLVRAGRVWAEFDGWTDRRFDSDPNIRANDRAPGRNTLSTVEDGGWTRVHERWPDLATRELIMRNQLGSAEREQYDAESPRGKRRWLLGRIAAKDAVRRWMWDHGEGEVFPAELLLRDSGIVGVHGRKAPPLTVSVASHGELGVGIARRGRCGIAVEPADDPDAEAKARAAAVEAFGVPSEVRCARIVNPPGLPAREYIVAWTADDEQETTT
ncbi:beta-ketoacyl synthase N-terminal-like domain-containing protein [Umezawaea sp. Da 62-37]|uniref:beta-ketoacyl synthase N-terminal-like domain-containing protein n=1 Tax=Umezawaea sp. Da 62-37 TaxID=3075927 RepID=UPI0028F6D56B|nr:beta-ketoacyl synthase N-terminal-like domain-containing protein [Umezawaea sp. Da 62-37]WNV89265.1 beta-ketoacyl synthase N-terminal-like domain-containing protein [Umezawaea sp. Da 62-37]